MNFPNIKDMINLSEFSIDPISQFKIKKIFDVHLFGIDISLTNSALMMIMGVIIFISITYFCCRKINGTPTKQQIMLEIAIKFVKKIVHEHIGKDGEKYSAFIFSLFFYILMGNMLGMIPFGFTFTAQIVVTTFLSMFAFLISIIIGFRAHGLKFLSIFIPKETPKYILPILIPIEIISFISRPFSLAIRLFANMVAGHAMIKVFASFVIILGITIGVLPFSINVILVGFEIMVAFLQSYIFVTLTSIYIGDALNLGSH
ncbi:F0F1 ATP synthase subunit A [Candidatus Gromoviella agglomerans]|uniref:F0F1 ATP synthase subunit A n=1 Tax=Candidatus Gromoviella agglomerans TaxID=2806609 RepID=UPI001E59DD20|nr:F0F1 ATP synthase subunit A [Candidatus Gromoviella agglomerans]